MPSSVKLRKRREIKRAYERNILLLFLLCIRSEFTESNTI